VQYSALHPIHFLGVIHYYITLTGKSFCATETSLRFKNKACELERKGRLSNDERDKTGLWDRYRKKSDSVSSSK